MRRWSWLAVLALTLGLSGGARPAGAQTLGPIIYDGGAAAFNASNTNMSDSAAPIQVGDPFALAGNTQLGGVRWWGSHLHNPLVNNFSVRIFTMTGESAAPTPLYDFSVGSAVNVTPYGTVPTARPQYQYEAVLPTTTLGAGTYLLSIVNNTGPDLFNSSLWYWTRTEVDGPTRFRLNDGSPWNNGTGSVAFQLTGAADTPAVPEPGSALLFLPALGVMAFIQRRQAS